LTPTSLNALDHHLLVRQPQQPRHGDCDQNPDRYRDRDSNRHSNSDNAPNSNSHTIAHVYSDGHRYANGSAERH
jgi:hypothetical protein